MHKHTRTQKKEFFVLLYLSLLHPLLFAIQYLSTIFRFSFIKIAPQLTSQIFNQTLNFVDYRNSTTLNDIQNVALKMIFA